MIQKKKAKKRRPKKPEVGPASKDLVEVLFDVFDVAVLMTEGVLDRSCSSVGETLADRVKMVHRCLGARSRSEVPEIMEAYPYHPEIARILKVDERVYRHICHLRMKEQEIREQLGELLKRTGLEEYG